MYIDIKNKNKTDRLSRVTILLSHLFRNNICVVKGDNTIVTSLLKKYRSCRSRQYDDCLLVQGEMLTLSLNISII